MVDCDCGVGIAPGKHGVLVMEKLIPLSDVSSVGTRSFSTVCVRSCKRSRDRLSCRLRNVSSVFKVGSRLGPQFLTTALGPHIRRLGPLISNFTTAPSSRGVNRHVRRVYGELTLVSLFSVSRIGAGGCICFLGLYGRTVSENRCAFAASLRRTCTRKRATLFMTGRSDVVSGVGTRFIHFGRALYRLKCTRQGGFRRHVRIYPCYGNSRLCCVRSYPGYSSSLLGRRPMLRRFHYTGVSPRSDCTCSNRLHYPGYRRVLQRVKISCSEPTGMCAYRRYGRAFLRAQVGIIYTSYGRISEPSRLLTRSVCDCRFAARNLRTLSSGSTLLTMDGSV